MKEKFVDYLFVFLNNIIVDKIVYSLICCN